MSNSKTEHGTRRERALEARRAKEGKYADRLAELDLALEAAEAIVEQQQPGTKEREIAEIRVEIAHLHLDTFLEEHDSTGAWKQERFGRDIAKDLRSVSFERDAEGKMAMTREDERSHLLIVNMSELDRLNASGAHALGDHGLKRTLELIESSVRGVLKQETSRVDEKRLSASYDIYRISGNDFGVILRDVDQEDAESLRQSLSRERVHLNDIRDGEEPVALTASRVSRADGIRILNSVGRVGEEGDDDFTVKNLIRAMEEKAQTLSDVEKVKVRSERALEKILAVEQGELTQAEAQDFFDKYLKKSIGKAFRDDLAQDELNFEQFQRLAKARGGAIDDVRSVEWIHLVAERSLGEAFDQLKARRAVGRDIENRIAKKIAGEVLKRDEHFGFVVDADVVPVSTPEFEPIKTISGKEKLKELEREATSLAERVSESEKAGALAERAQATFELERAKRDAGRTGLYTRGQFFRAMESGLIAGKPVTTVAIDMAFLKYFDKEGGPATGDLAIEKTAEILDRVAREYDGTDISVEAYRTGGDEFALTIVGGTEKATADVLNRLRELRKTAGRIPAQAGANATYIPEELQFNYGIRSAASRESFAKELVDAGISLQHQGDLDEVNELAEYLTLLADKEIEIYKAADRILFLALHTERARKTNDPRNLETLKKYSEKGIFGAEGMRMVEEMADLLETGNGVEGRLATQGMTRGKILAFVLEQLVKKREVKQGVDSAMDQRIEEAVTKRYLEQRVSELESTVVDLQMRLHTEKEKSKELRGMAAAAEHELAAVVHLRERLAGTSPPERRRAA